MNCNAWRCWTVGDPLKLCETVVTQVTCAVLPRSPRPLFVASDRAHTYFVLGTKQATGMLYDVTLTRIQLTYILCSKSCRRGPAGTSSSDAVLAGGHSIPSILLPRRDCQSGKKLGTQGNSCQSQAEIFRSTNSHELWLLRRADPIHVPCYNVAVLGSEKSDLACAHRPLKFELKHYPQEIACTC